MESNNIMHLKRICILMLIFVLGCKSSTTAKQEDKPIKPNILLIYTDQQRYNTIKALGNSQIKTPNLDKLVKQGTAFTHSYVTAPVCKPSRWSLFSGMYTTSHEAYSNHHASTRPETSLPLELKKIGYETALLGKNHAFLEKGVDMDINIKMPKDPARPKDKRSTLIAMDWTLEEDPTHLITNEALNILKKTKETKKPLFMWLSYLYPHTPFMAPEPYFSMYNDVDIPEPVKEKDGLKAAGKPFRQQFHKRNNNLLLPYDKEKTMRMKRNYYGMISLVDNEIGRLIKFLEDNDMRENTLIIFTSDHGDYMGDHGLYTKSPAMYDCLVRVPLIFSMPKTIKENNVTDELASNIDLMPTILDMVNLPIPNQVQGVSLESGLLGNQFKKSREYVFSEYGIPGKPITEEEVEKHLGDLNENPIDYAKGVPWEANPVALSGRFRMIRSKDYKLVEELNGTNELYDMSKDPNELVNLYGDEKYSEIQEKLLKELHLWKNELPGIEKDDNPMGQESFKDLINKRKNGK